MVQDDLLSLFFVDPVTLFCGQIEGAFDLINSAGTKWLTSEKGSFRQCGDIFNISRTDVQSDLALGC